MEYNGKQLSVEERKKLGDDNTNLIYSFLNDKKYSIEEYYDIAAIGYCKAVNNYNPDKGCFSTFAYLCMQSQMLIEFRNQKKIIQCTSLDEPICSDDENKITLLHMLESPCSTDEIFLKTFGYSSAKELIKSMCEKGVITNKESDCLIAILVNGRKQKEYAKSKKLSQPQISRIYINGLNKICKFFNK